MNDIINYLNIEKDNYCLEHTGTVINISAEFESAVEKVQEAEKAALEAIGEQVVYVDEQAASAAASAKKAEDVLNSAISTIEEQTSVAVQNIETQETASVGAVSNAEASALSGIASALEQGKTDLNNHTQEKISEYDLNAENKINAYNSNHQEKLLIIDGKVTEATDQAQNSANSAIQSAQSASEAEEWAEAAASAARETSSGFNLFDSKWSDHLINDIKWLRADNFSWQDGTVYSEAYNELAYFKNNLKLEISSAGNLIIKAGSTYSYPNGFEDDGVTPKFVQVTSTQDIAYGFGTSTGLHMVLFDNTSASSWYRPQYISKGKTPPTETVNYMSWYDTENNFVKGTSNYGETWTVTNRAVIALVTLDNGKVTAINQIFNGVNGFDYKEESGIGFCQSDKGYKIALANQETAIVSLYNSTGVAWYYILDTANRRFKLPRTKWGFVGLRDTVGGYVAESLPNITASLTGDLRTQGGLTPGGAFTTTEQGNSYTGFGLYNGKQITAINLNASRSSAAYQNNAPVQQRATQMYLYFYVGKFNQTATEQTAGLKAELFNGKADLNLSNVSANIDYVVESYRNGTSWYRIYKSGWIEQGGQNKTGTSNTALTVNLLKPFSSTNYNVLVSTITAKLNVISVQSKAASNFTCLMMDYNNNVATSFSWYAFGQGA